MEGNKEIQVDTPLNKTTRGTVTAEQRYTGQQVPNQRSLN